MTRRRTSLAMRCWQGIATPIVLVAVAFAVVGVWHLGEWLVRR